jgi:hypothetical protein
LPEEEAKNCFLLKANLLENELSVKAKKRLFICIILRGKGLSCFGPVYTNNDYHVARCHKVTKRRATKLEANPSVCRTVSRDVARQFDVCCCFVWICRPNQLFSLRDTAVRLRSQRPLHVQGDAGHPG